MCEHLHLLRYRLLRVDEEVFPVLLAVGEDLDIRDLNDAVVDQVQARRLQVEDDERTLEVEFHSFFCVIFQSDGPSPDGVRLLASRQAMAVSMWFYTFRNLIVCACLQTDRLYLFAN